MLKPYPYWSIDMKVLLETLEQDGVTVKRVYTHLHLVDGVYFSMFAQSIPNIEKSAPNSTFEIVDEDEGYSIQEQNLLERNSHVIGKPIKIDKARFEELLECLPPRNYVNLGGSVSFRISECLFSNFFTHCVKVGDQFFELVERIGTTHNQLVNTCLNNN